MEVPAKEECKEIEVAIGLSLGDEEHLERSRAFVATLEATKAELKKVGALSVCVSIDHEIDKERRRMRALSKQNTAVADALAIRRGAEEVKALQSAFCKTPRPTNKPGTNCGRKLLVRHRS